MEDPPVEMAPVALRDLGLSTETSKRVRAAWTSSAHGRLARLDVVAASLGPLGTRSVTSPTTAAASSSESSFTSPHQGSVMDIRIDGSKEFVLSCSLDGSMAVSQATVSGQLAALCSVRRDSVGAHLQGVYSVCWYPHDNGMFVSGSQDKTVKVWDTNALEAVLTFNLEGPVYETRMSPVETSTHNLVAIAGDMHHVTLGDISSGSATHILGTGAGAAVWTCAWSCRSEWELISGSVDGQVRLWDIRRPGTRWVYDSNDVGGRCARAFRSFIWEGCGLSSLSRTCARARRCGGGLRQRSGRRAVLADDRERRSAETLGHGLKTSHDASLSEEMQQDEIHPACRVFGRRTAHVPPQRKRRVCL